MDRTGLTISDRNGKSLYQSRFPSAVYQSFDSIPQEIVKTLLFIEDQNLLDSARLRRNPAVDWPRFIGAMLRYSLSRFLPAGNVAGASTLATQLEKFRYSPDGITYSAKDKIIQMYSASLRAYSSCEQTLSSRRELIRQYINSAPLAAFPNYGEVNGLSEGLEIWYGVPFDSVNSTLRDSTADLDTRARYFRMVLSLMIAHRRPNYYLVSKPVVLSAITDHYLRLLNVEGIISDKLMLSALKQTISPRSKSESAKNNLVYNISAKKSVGVVRTPLLNQLAVSRLYDLDRIDCTVKTTLDSALMVYVNDFFRSLRSPHVLDSLGLHGFRMLSTGDPTKVIHSITLYERSRNSNLLRLQVDSYENPLNINEGIKLDLGSTAKLRTLITYLEIVEELHKKYVSYPKDSLHCVETAPDDHISKWALDYLAAARDSSLDTMLQAAILRDYSANPSERFFTGGGVHAFVNFDKRHDHLRMTVQEGLRHSVNLVFVRLMRDIVNYQIGKLPGAHEMLSDTTGVMHEQYLRKFVEYESHSLLKSYFRRLRPVKSSDMADTLATGIRPTPGRLSLIYCTVNPSPSENGLSGFLSRHGIADTSSASVVKLFKKYSSENLTLSDRGFLGGIHPLKLWTAHEIAVNPQIAFNGLEQQSLPNLEGIYRWLYNTRNKSAKESRVRRILEFEAFEKIHEQWQKLGYPFAELIPSYATALGASADRPIALAELIGIVQNGGLKLPMVKVTGFHFAEGTPYETILEKIPNEKGPQVISPQVAHAVRNGLFDVVNQGTAVRARNAFQYDSVTLTLGGKTGTGDHRLRRFNKAGVKVEEKVLNRTATFVFFIGERFFGTIVAMVPGESAKDYHFTSSYPVQLLRLLSPALKPLLREDAPISTDEPASKKSDFITEKHNEGVYEMKTEGVLDTLRNEEPDSVQSKPEIF